MPLISYMGTDYDSPNIQVQNNGSATDLDNNKIPTGQTIESYIDKNVRNNEVGSWVNIASYTSTMYTCPSDGYVMFNGSNALIEFHGATNDNYFYAQTTTTSVVQTVFVRKGMRIKVVGTISLCRFIPLS